jgi:hypothetical protein
MAKLIFCDYFKMKEREGGEGENKIMLCLHIKQEERDSFWPRPP